ncbi:hypothetical protein GMOD_00009819 [Pyrenophora seminiperda CCB06]|uniref:Uncharacterized protein n=1 Tax=Pyrenophora seminiperda CCB06 TaxID=1302712 RepID=A0A3M7ME17_9PLEO|nr:hypothetical protein GMOD_00009819 [Pyrenophora seminiperda CCB06]
MTVERSKGLLMHRMHPPLEEPHAVRQRPVDPVRGSGP